MLTEVSEISRLALLGSSLAIGLLIGMERGWKAREEKEGTRIAGLRTYGLIGLLGGASGMLAELLGVVVFGLLFLGFSATTVYAYAVRRSLDSDVSITSLVAILLTFVLGGLATQGQLAMAAPAAVLATMLLGFKEELHGWLRKLERNELYAVLQLLLISIVMLPVLPNQGFGPWGAINPYEIWWMVVLIASISFVGYFTMRVAGAGRGIILTALAAGLASSTALTLNYANLARQGSNIPRLLAAGILLACGTMFPRMLLVAGIINPDLVSFLAWPLGLMMVITWTTALVYWHRKNLAPDSDLNRIGNPLQLKTALFFGLLLAVIILLGKAIEEWSGHSGLYVLAAVSGIADVDPINLTLSKMSLEGVPLNIAVMGIVLASSVNSVLKGLLAIFIGGKAVGFRVLLPLLFVAALGLTVAWLQ